MRHRVSQLNDLVAVSELLEPLTLTITAYLPWHLEVGRYAAMPT